MISYEYPLNERIRTLLRLEDLFLKIAHFTAGAAPQDHHVALLTTFETLEVASRADRIEKPERLANTARRIGKKPQVRLPEPGLDSRRRLRRRHGRDENPSACRQPHEAEHNSRDQPDLLVPRQRPLPPLSRRRMLRIGIHMRIHEQIQVWDDHRSLRESTNSSSPASSAN